MFVPFESESLSRAPSISVPRTAVPKALRQHDIRLKTGQFLYHQGDEARTIYRVNEGVLRLACVTENGHQQVIAFGYPGDIVGLPVRGLRSTDCDALNPARVTAIPARLPEDSSGGAAEAAFLAATALCELGAMQEHMMTLGQKSSRERVASFLLVLMRRVGQHDEAGIHVHLPMSRAGIADFLGIRMETVSRAFTDFRHAGVIELPSAQHVTGLDPAGLQRLAEID